MSTFVMISKQKLEKFVTITKHRIFTTYQYPLNISYKKRYFMKCNALLYDGL
jgi:hypothetical protein